MHPVRNRILRLLALLMVGALVAVACGGDSGESAGGDGAECPVDALDDADGPVEVTLWHTYVGLTSETLNTIADEYNASQDKVKVNGREPGHRLRGAAAQVPPGHPQR